MDIEYLKYLKKERTPEEKISNELFKSTSEQHYYNFGVACGLSYLYKILKKSKDITFTGKEVMDALQISADNFDKEIHDYFIEIIKGSY